MQLLAPSALFASVVAGTPAPAPSLRLINQTLYPHARCLDGSAPAYYWRDGRGARGAKSLVLFLEGGGWCYPSDIQQPCEPKSSHCGANCHIRAAMGGGSSASYAPSVPATAFEGGTGIISGDPALTGFADFAVAYVKYCDGGSFSGTMTVPDVALNETGPLYYAGKVRALPHVAAPALAPAHSPAGCAAATPKYNLDAVMAELVAAHGVGGYERVVLSGCSAGGMSCYLHCDRVAAAFKAAAAPHDIDVRCICDAGMFIDVPTVTGAGNVMRTRFFDLADKMGTKESLNPKCVAAEPDW